jgi:hypothetical protein
MYCPLWYIRGKEEAIIEFKQTITYNMFQTLKEKYLHHKARRKLISQYEYLQQVNLILEKYLTQKLLDGGNEEFMNKGRKDLSEKQAEIRTNAEFIAFLKTKV